jgi:heme/copper-type cytochrome/quinol oxidase subunit 4
MTHMNLQEEAKDDIVAVLIPLILTFLVLITVCWIVEG